MSETNELEALARRAVACKRWRWMPGAADTRGGRIVKRLDYAGAVRLDRSTVQYAGPNGGASWFEEVQFAESGPTGLAAVIPDLSDAATLGCLLALVREASGDPLAHTYPLAAGGWACWFGCVDRSGATEAEAMIAVLETIAEHAALVAALEAAPEVKP